MNVEHAHVASLAGFDRMTTARLRSLLNGRSAVEAFALASGAIDPTGGVAALFERDPALRERWRRSAELRDPVATGEWCDRLGVAVTTLHDPDYPPVLADDPQRPPALFVRGDLAALGARRVAIVGTRNPTQRGLQTAARFGHDLSDAGVTVVSGLARGIDAAAHRGALSADGARPVGVVANGHDQPYPKQNTGLWDAVAEAGAVVSEWPPGTAPDAFRFPQRNRIIAALAEVVVVVESRERGGSLITAQLAAERGIGVFAVPGPVDARSSSGTNRLLDDGAGVATEAADLLIALGLDGRRSGGARYDPRPRPRGREAEIVDLCRSEPRDVEAVADALGCPVVEAALALARLERSGWLCETGGWFEVLDSWASVV